MNLFLPLAPRALPGAPSQATNELADGDFEKLYAFFQTFSGDHETAISNALQTFRETESNEYPCRETLFAKAVSRIRGEGNGHGPIEGAGLTEGICWLLKELGDLPYRSIAEILGLGMEETRVAIAQVRSAIIRRALADNGHGNP
jgi:hypothetical protein